VATVAPLASDPAFQQAIADQVTAQVLTYLDVPGLTNQVVDGLAERGLQIGAVILACLALVFWSQPTGKVVLGLTLALLGVLALIEFLGRRPADTRVEAQAPVE